MRKLALSLGSGRQAAAWRPAAMTVDQIWDKIEHPIRTAETTAQYWQMTRNEREVVKDKGAFVGGTLKGTRRKKEEVVSRSMVTMDYDKLTPDFFESYEESHRYFTMLYTTHSYLPEAPRARLLIPLTRDVTPEEYNAIVRFLAAEISMTMIDVCSFKINQLMFWPSCSSDGDYICRRYEGEWLDPDTFLAEHPNWRDYSSLPSAPGEKDEVNRQHKLQEDPLKKTGIVGAVCRTYSPQDGIAKFLSHIYCWWRPGYSDCSICDICGRCNFTLRDDAKYYVDQLFMRDKPSVKGKQTLFAKIMNMEKRLTELNTGYEGEIFRQLLYCVCVRYIRKAALETTAILSRTETERVLIRALKQGTDESDAE